MSRTGALEHPERSTDAARVQQALSGDCAPFQVHLEHMMQSLKLVLEAFAGRPPKHSVGTITCPKCGGLQRWARGSSQAIFSKCDTEGCMEWHSLR